MHRLIASSLLVVILAGIFAPAAMALSQESPHACCLRKQSHCRDGVQADPALSSGGCAQHSCCQTLTGRQWAQAALPLTFAAKKHIEPTLALADIPLHRSDLADSHFGRAPPAGLTL